MSYIAVGFKNRTEFDKTLNYEFYNFSSYEEINIVSSCNVCSNP